VKRGTERPAADWNAATPVEDEVGMRVPSTQSFEFGPYAQILKTLLPRSRVIYLYAPDAQLLWSSDGTDSTDLRPAIVGLIEAAKANPATDAAGGRHMLDDAPAFTFLLRDELGAVLGVSAVICCAVSREAEIPSFESVERTLAPLLVLARRDLGAQRALIETGRFNVADTQELEWLLDVTHVDAPAGGGDALQTLLDAFAARSECDLALLQLPGRRLERVSARCPLPAGEVDTLRAVVARHLLRVAQLQQRTLIINKVRDGGAGGLVPYRILCVPLLRGGQVAGVAVAFNRAANRPFANREARMLERLAPRLLEIVDVRFDTTTGLLTRHAFDEQAAALLRRSPQGTRAIVYADIDQLQKVNDLFGFDAGDAVLRAVADAWREQGLPPESSTARLAGDRFIALLERTTADGAHAWAEATRLAVAALTLPDPWAGIALSASFGVATLGAGGTLEHALVGAESACRYAKERGRNRVERFSPPEERIARQQGELRLYRDLLDAFEKGRFRLFAQPLAPMWDPSRPVRYEILVRLLDARQQPVPAELFLPIAARHQLLGRLDRWVLGELLSQLAACGAALDDTTAVFSLNLSAQSLQQADLAGQIGTALASARVPPSLINFEINEHAVVDRLNEAGRFLTEINALGCTASIDDFGTGGSSLLYLTSLKLDALKIDGSFIRDLLTNPRSESMVRAILQIARQLELDTVAECVESKEAAAHLATLGVTYGQGLGLAEPRPLGEVLDELVRRAAPRLVEAIIQPAPDALVH
jgi:diguanylate cyclase (GGDEF)-like protein